MGRSARATPICSGDEESAPNSSRKLPHGRAGLVSNASRSTSTGSGALCFGARRFRLTRAALIQLNCPDCLARTRRSRAQTRRAECLAFGGVRSSPDPAKRHGRTPMFRPLAPGGRSSPQPVTELPLTMFISDPKATGPCARPANAPLASDSRSERQVSARLFAQRSERDTHLF
jgi:hypothetical protein